ncbi:MAG: flavodoxin family protein [Candidatus Bathyarchaeia archaeon]|jgi:NAD(P)H dehydrogenase (quinone)
MVKILIVYDTMTGHTEKMAFAVAKGAEKTGAEVTTKKADQTTPEDMLASDGIIMGSPVYFGQMTAKLKQLFDDSVRVYHKLEGKVGGAFASSGGLASGGETTLLSIIEAMLIHGMIVQGRSEDKHYGVSVEGEPKPDDLAECEILGQRVALLTKKLNP